MYFEIAKVALALLNRRPRPLAHHLKNHFGRCPRKFPVVTVEYSRHRHACVFLAIQRYLAGRNRYSKMLGLSTTDTDLRFSDFLHPDAEYETDGPVQYCDVELANGNSISCAQRAIYLVRDDHRRLAIHLIRPHWEDNMTVEVIARDRWIAEKFLADMRGLADQQSIYKGQIVSLKEDRDRNLVVYFQKVPSVPREQLILPESVIQQIERHTTRFSQHRELLLSRGRHLKRGLLLYGPPGTGKSLSIMHLLSEMKGRTGIILNGNAVQHLEDACTLARALQPATVVIDDVDLVAEERTRRNFNPVLFELLNQMDGIADDADVLFLLTTNRPESLEPALASRPGRIDQAIMIPLPDAQCRARLFDLYSKGLPMKLRSTKRFIEQTEGVSAAYIRELSRKAALLAAEEGRDVPVQDRHIKEALQHLQQGSPLTGKLLGYDAGAQVTKASAPESSSFAPPG